LAAESERRGRVRISRLSSDLRLLHRTLGTMMINGEVVGLNSSQDFPSRSLIAVVVKVCLRDVTGGRTSLPVTVLSNAKAYASLA
jgi:hypothetical protein